MKTAVCAVAKLENHYIREWVEHQKQLGFDTIFLYDNNLTDGETFDEVIGDYIQSQFVKVINVRGLIDVQTSSYQKCYELNSNKYDWIGFFDVDEFLYLDGKDIKTFLNNPVFQKFNFIKFHWQNFDDNGLLKPKNNNYSITRFSHPIAVHSQVTKCFIRTKIKGLYFYSAHGPLSPESETNDKLIRACNTYGQPCKNIKDLSDNIPSVIRLYHYSFKTIYEYMFFKCTRGYATKYADFGRDCLTMHTFYTYNKRTILKTLYAFYLFIVKRPKLVAKSFFGIKARFHRLKNKIYRLFKKGN